MGAETKVDTRGVPMAWGQCRVSGWEERCSGVGRVGQGGMGQEGHRLIELEGTL